MGTYDISSVPLCTKATGADVGLVPSKASISSHTAYIIVISDLDKLYYNLYT